MLHDLTLELNQDTVHAAELLASKEGVGVEEFVAKIITDLVSQAG